MADWLIFLRGDTVTQTTSTNTPEPPVIPNVPQTPAVNVKDWVAFELPFFESEGTARLGVVAIKPNDNQADAQVLLDNIAQTPILQYQLTTATITADITRLARTATFSRAVSDVVMINDEFIRIGAATNNANEYNIERGLGDTIPTVHQSGSSVHELLYLWESVPLNFVVSHQLALVSRSTSGVSYPSPPQRPYSVRGRYRRPICPANIRVNGSYDGTAAITGEVRISYNARTRSSTAIDWYSATSQTPEANAQVEVRITIGTGGGANAMTVSRTVAQRSSSTITISASDMFTAVNSSAATVELNVYTSRDGLNSLSTFVVSFPWSHSGGTGWHFNWGSGWGGPTN